MSNKEIASGKIESIRVMGLDANGIPVSGSSWTLKIIRDDGYFWNGSAFINSVQSVVLTEIDAIKRPGEYSYNFSSPQGQYICTLIATTSDTAVQTSPAVGLLSVGLGTAQDSATAKKYVRNKTTLSDSISGTYAVYDDDGTTVFETGTFDGTTREPN